MNNLQIFEQQILQAEQGHEKEAARQLMQDRLLMYCENAKIEELLFENRMKSYQFLQKLRDLLLLPFPKFLIEAHQMGILNAETISCYRIEKKW